MGHALPGVGHVGGQSVLDSLPSADVAQTDPDQGKQAGDDEEELEYFVINRARQPAEEDVSEHDQRRENDGDMEDVGVGQDVVEEAQLLDEQGHGIHLSLIHI